MYKRQAFANGLAPTNIYTSNITFSVIFIGGMGVTLALNVMMCRSKSKRLKRFGQVALVPSLFNINEPLVYGCLLYTSIDSGDSCQWFTRIRSA